MVICLERGADLHMAQLIPLPLTVSCFSKIPVGFTFLVPAHPVPLNGCVCVLVLVPLLSTRCCPLLSLGPGGRYCLTAGTRRRQLSVDICCPRPSVGEPAARRCCAVSIDGTYRDGQTDTPPLPRRLLLEEGNVSKLVKINGV